jgi:hypothetical protein
MPRSTIALGAAAVLASLVPAAGLRAEPSDEVRLYLENDSLLNPFESRTDRYYTHGTRVERFRLDRGLGARFLPGVSHSDWCRLICGKGARRGVVDSGIAVGQNMYTPANILIAEPQPQDRPWGGFLYASRIARVSYKQSSLRAQRQDRFEVGVGVVGPASLAAETQIEFHRLIGADRPAGWANQLRNEPVLQLRYDTALRWPEDDRGHADLIPRVRANLGNVQTSIEAEITGRIGWNLSGFGADTIVAAFAPEETADSRRSSRWRRGGNLFVRGGVKAIARNIFIDGNSFVRDEIRVRRTPVVPEIGAGFELNLIRNFSLTFQFVHRRSEFRSRSGRRAPAQEFGSVNLVWMFGR